MRRYQYICDFCLSEWTPFERVFEENELCPECLEGKIHLIDENDYKKFIHKN